MVLEPGGGLFDEDFLLLRVARRPHARGVHGLRCVGDAFIYTLLPPALWIAALCCRPQRCKRSTAAAPVVVLKQAEDSYAPRAYPAQRSTPSCAAAQKSWASEQHRRWQRHAPRSSLATKDWPPGSPQAVSRTHRPQEPLSFQRPVPHPPRCGQRRRSSRQKKERRRRRPRAHSPNRAPPWELAPFQSPPSSNLKQTLHFEASAHGI